MTSRKCCSARARRRRTLASDMPSIWATSVKQESGIIPHQQERPLVFAEACESLLDKLKLSFRIILRRLRNVAVRRRSDRVLSLLLQAVPPASISHGLEALAARNGEQPGTHRCLPAKARHGFVHRQKHVLRNILAVVDVADHVDTEANHRSLIPLHERLQGLMKRSGRQGALHVAVTSLLRGPVHTT